MLYLLKLQEDITVQIKYTIEIKTNMRKGLLEPQTS